MPRAKRPAPSPRPKTRPRVKPPADRSREIVAAAFAEFSAHGFAATRLDDVARRARVAKGTIFLHFPSKQQLFVAVVRSLIGSVFAEFRGLAEGPPKSAEGLLGELFSRLYAALVRNEKAGGILRMLIAECGNFPELAQVWRQEVIGPGLAAFRQVLRQGAAAGEFRRSRVEDFPQILAAPAIMAVLWGLLVGKREPLDLDAYFATHLDFVLCGLRPAEGEPPETTLPGDSKSETRNSKPERAARSTEGETT